MYTTLETLNRPLIHINTGRCGTFFMLYGYAQYLLPLNEVKNLEELQKLFSPYGPFVVSAYALPLHEGTLPESTFSDAEEALQHLIRKTPDGSVGMIKTDEGKLLCHFDCT